MARVLENPDKALPLRRKWVSVKNQSTDGVDSFVVVSYNILADCHVSPHTYPYLAEGYRTMTERHPQLLMELLHHNEADVICLQEVDFIYFNEMLAPALSTCGYKGIQCNKTLGTDEGPATFYKQSRFDLKQHKVVYFKDQMQQEVKKRPLPPDQSEAILEKTLKETVMMLLQLQCKRTGQILTLGNVHPFWMNHIAMDVITLQVALAVNTLVQFANDVSSALILCGDFNTEPHMPAYELLQDGCLSDRSVKTLRGFTIAAKDSPTKSLTLIDVMSSCFLHPVAHFQSAYKTATGDEVPFSQFHDTDGSEWRELQQTGARELTERNDSGEKGHPSRPNGKQIRALDYLWFSSKSLGCQGVLEMVPREVLDALYACPNTVFPSDHLLMKASFYFKETVS